jgi:hypothetical protein
VIPVGPNLSVDGSQAMLGGHNQKFIKNGNGGFKNNQSGVLHSSIKFNQNKRVNNMATGPSLGRAAAQANTDKKHVQMQKFFLD